MAHTVPVYAAALADFLGKVRDENICFLGCQVPIHVLCLKV